MKPKPVNPLKSILHPYIFVLKEGGKDQKRLFRLLPDDALPSFHRNNPFALTRQSLGQNIKHKAAKARRRIVIF